MAKITSPIKKIITWIVSGLIAVGGLMYLYNYIQEDQKRDDDIESRLLSSPEMKVRTEDFMIEESSYSKQKNLEALNKMTDKYISLTTTVDTMSIIAISIYNSIELNKERNQAILNLVHRMDSIVSVLVKENKEIKSDIFTIKTFDEALLRSIKKLKSLENFSGD